MSNKTRKQRMQKLLTMQRISGLCLVMVGIFCIVMALTAKFPEDTDATAALLFIPLGVSMFVSKKAWVYGGAYNG